MKPARKPKSQTFEEYVSTAEEEMLKSPKLVKNALNLPQNKFLWAPFHEIFFSHTEQFQAADRGQELSGDEDDLEAESEKIQFPDSDSEGILFLPGTNRRICQRFSSTLNVTEVRNTFQCTDLQMRKMLTWQNQSLKGCGTSTSLTGCPEEET